MPAVSPELLAELFDHHAPALVLFARQWCGTPEDVVQEAFVALARQRALPDQPVAWLYRVVRNGAISHGRADRRREAREARASRPEAWFESADDRLAAHEATRLLAELDPETREIVVARLWGGLSFDAIAQLVGSSISTAHRKYQSGLARLQSRLESPCPQPTPNPTIP
jgi:RNA polymerase sigma-70 factor (ECF subfamily)